MRQERKERRGVLVICGFLAVICSCFLGVSMTLHTIVMRTVEESGVSEALTDRMVDVVFAELGLEDEDLLADAKEMVRESEEVQQIAEKMMREIILCLEQGTEFTGADLDGELDQLISSVFDKMGTTGSSLIDRLKDRLEETVRGQTSSLEELINSYGIQAYERISSMSGAGGMALRAFEILNTAWFPALMAVVLLFMVLLTFRFSASAPAALLYLGIEGACVGILYIFALRGAGDRLMGALSERIFGETLALQTKPLLTIGIACLAAGAVMAVVGLIWGQFRRRRDTL